MTEAGRLRGWTHRGHGALTPVLTPPKSPSGRAGPGLGPTPVRARHPGCRVLTRDGSPRQQVGRHRMDLPVWGRGPGFGGELAGSPAGQGRSFYNSGENTRSDTVPGTVSSCAVPSAKWRQRGGEAPREHRGDSGRVRGEHRGVPAVPVLRMEALLLASGPAPGNTSLDLTPTRSACGQNLAPSSSLLPTVAPTQGNTRMVIAAAMRCKAHSGATAEASSCPCTQTR